MAKSAEILSCVAIVTATLLWILSISIKEVSGLGCFVCSTINGSNPNCEDTFNSTTETYVQQCKAGRKGRGGLFPGTECIKLKAELGSYKVVVRDCTVHNGDLTSDSEMGGVEECTLVNQIKYNGIDMNGCVISCTTDGCNLGTVTKASRLTLCMGVLTSLMRMLL